MGEIQTDVWTEREEERVLHVLFTPPLLDPDVPEQRNIYRTKEKKITPSRTWTVHVQLPLHGSQQSLQV